MSKSEQHSPPEALGGKDRTGSACKENLQAGPFLHVRGDEMDYKAEYIKLLKQALAAETEAVRLYTAMMAIAPASILEKLLEVNADETDHQAIIADLLLEAVAGESADQEERIPGVD